MSVSVNVKKHSSNSKNQTKHKITHKWELYGQHKQTKQSIYNDEQKVQIVYD